MATRVDDCALWQVVWLEPQAVRPIVVDAPRPVLGWEELQKVLPERPPLESQGWWSPVWEAATAVALAHLLAVSEGVRVTVPDGLLADVFRRALDTLLPPEPPAKSLALAGPGLSSTVADIELVPLHPQTGEIWASDAEAVVPLAADVWMYLAFNDSRRLLPAMRRLPEGVYRDDPLPLLPSRLFHHDRYVFLGTLERLPEVRQPWLRAIYDDLRDRRTYDLFW
ncbi:hypothetical protein [Rhizohabitans arisaemae]|uniref:hypothetical protein n=1 Tax=Rhizohabitans arisaemae TaxID=2720610 RepID=UPI0024B1F77D|nr:hypothetical protein [Rhizohabitans arisaemae]